MNLLQVVPVWSSRYPRISPCRLDDNLLVVDSLENQIGDSLRYDKLYFVHSLFLSKEGMNEV